MTKEQLENRITQLELELRNIRPPSYDHHFCNLVEEANHPILILKGEDMLLEIANAAFFKIWSVDKAVLGKPLLEILPEMKDQPFMELLLDVLHNNRTRIRKNQPAQFTRKNGEIKTEYFNFVCQPYKEHDETVSGVIVFANDVTAQVEQKTVFEKSLFERRSELHTLNKDPVFPNIEKEKRSAELIIANSVRSLIEASYDPLVTISATGKILDVNEASIKVTGVSRGKLIATDFSNYFTHPEKAQQGYRQVFERGFVADFH